MILSIYHIVTHTQLYCISEREADGIRERTIVGDHLMSLGFTIAIGAYSIFEEVARFYLLWLSQGKYLCLLSLVIDCCACYYVR